MSIDAVLSGAFSSLKTVQQQIALTSNNINNANTPGYSRKSVGLSPTGDGVNQVGVEITNYARATDRILLKQLNAAITDSGAKDVQKQYLDQVQNLLGSSSDSVRLTTYLSDFSASWQQLQAEPENTALQTQVITTGSSFATEIRRSAAQIEQLDRSIQADTSAAVTNLNSALKIIDTANANIAQALSSNLPIGNYEDQRDAAVQTIAKYVDVRVIDRSNGQIALYTPQGYGLLDGKASQFSFSGNSITVTGSATSINNELRGGKLKALLDLRADTSPAAANPDPTQEVIRKLRSQLDTLANSFLTASTSPDSFAQAYNAAASNSGALASGFFTGTSRTDFSVNASLLNGTATVKQQAGTTVNDTLKTDTRSFTAYGQTVNNVSYSGYAQEIISVWQAGAKNATASANTATTQTSYVTKLATDRTGVNVDEELINLQVLQRSYQASARLISVVQQLNQTLLDTVR